MRTVAPICVLATVLACNTLLAADLAEPIPACEDRMGRVLNDFATILPGVTTKAHLQKLLRQDGGAFTPKTMRFLHPLCAYCKVEVTFKVTRGFDGHLISSDSDVVEQVSKPYLETLFID